MTAQAHTAARRFPMMDETIKSVPWPVVQAVEPQIMRNHGRQTAERLAQRGGLDVCELAAALEGLGWGSITDPTRSREIIWAAIAKASGEAGHD